MKSILSALLVLCILLNSAISVAVYALETPASPAPNPTAAPTDPCGGLSPFSEFIDTSLYTYVRIKITDRGGIPLPNAVYALYRSDGTFIENLTTGADGTATSSLISTDEDCYIVEAAPPAGYKSNPARRDITFNEGCAPALIEITVEYDEITGRFKIIKTDENGNPVPGVTFRIYKANGGSYLESLTTGADGTVTSMTLTYGEYEIYEYNAPSQYVNGGSVYRSITVDGQTVEVRITNYFKKGTLRIDKTGNDGRLIEGAVFSIYSNDGDWITSVTTNSSGRATASGLVAGRYYAVETSVPYGYTLDSTPRYFDITYNGQTLYLEIENEVSGSPGKVKITKVDDNSNALSGVVFGVYRAWDNKKLTELITGPDGTVMSDYLIPGDYYLVELVGKEGYTQVAGRIYFTIGTWGGTESVIVVNPKTISCGNVRVIKLDDQGNPLPGVRFGVYCHLDNLQDVITTSTDGSATSKILSNGDYYVQELESMTGYLPDDTKYWFTVTADSATITKTITNQRVAGNIKVIKTGDGGQPLSGVVFEIYQNNSLIGILTTDGYGEAVSNTLYYGDYELRELSAADGYELLSAPIPFSILDHNQTVEIPVSNSLIIGGIRVLKTDEAGRPLPGAAFGLYDALNEQINTLITGGDGMAETGNLVKGNYYLRELTAPAGYAPINDDIPFSISENGVIVQKTVVNSLGSATLKIIKTGESGEALPGVEFEIYRTLDDTIVGQITTGLDGSAQTTLTLGSYYLIETQTVLGYALPGGNFPFNLTTHGETVELPIQNALIPEPEDGLLRLIKKAEVTEDLLPGAVFELFYGNTGERITILTTEIDGLAEYGLPAGDYYLIEQTAPQGFQANADRIDFTITSGETEVVTVYNTPEQPKTGFLRIVKKAESTDELLPGAVFGLYELTTYTQIAALTTEADGTVVYELAAGDYCLVELTAPQGFGISTEPVYFTVTEGETEIITVYNSPQAPEPPESGHIKLTKMVDGLNILLPGAVFGVYCADNDNKITELTTGEDGTATSSELDVGNYYLVEITAPAGYAIRTDRINVTVEANETTEVTAYNAPLPPESGYIALTKQDAGTSAKLKDAVFGVYNAETDAKDAELTTGSDGTAITGELEPGEYYLLELAAPFGYMPITEKILVDVLEGETSKVTVYNTPLPTKGTIRLAKNAQGTGEPLEGAIFGVYTVSGDIKVSELITGGDGTAASGELPAGSYYIREITAPFGYMLNNDKIGVTVTAGEISEVTVINNPVPVVPPTPPTTGFIRLIKIAGDTAAPLPGAVLGIFTASNDVKVGELITGADGKAVSGELPIGSYYVREITAPVGYMLNNDKIGVTVTAGEISEVTVINNSVPVVPPAPPTTGFIRLIKIAGDTAAPLPGAVFGIFTASNDVKVGELITGEDGTAASGELPAGSYYVRELTAPDGYVLSYDKIGITVKAGETGDVTVINSPVPSIPPAPATTGFIRLTKTAEDTGTPLSGVGFGIYTASNDVRVGELITGEDGTATSGELPAGSYYVRELRTLDGYVLSSEKIGVTVTAGEMNEVAVANAPVPSTPPAPMTTGFINITKTAEDTAAPLPGVVFGVYTASNDVKVGELITGEDGTVISGELPAGSYYVLELKAHEGYVLSNEKNGVSVKAGETSNITVTNAPIPTEQPAPDISGFIRLVKLDESTGEPLKGAVFGIYTAFNDVKVGELITEEDGTAISDGLPAGYYYVREIKAPEGYIINNEKIGVTIKIGEISEIIITNAPIPPGQPAPVTDGSIRLTKKNGSTAEPLNGAVFGVYTINDVKVCELTTGEDGTATSGELPAGSYYIREITAPEGFILSNEKIGVTVKPGETSEITVLNAPIPPDLPQPDITGFIRLVKLDEETGEPLVGAVFGIYTVSNDIKVGELVTDEEGMAASAGLPAGYYYVRELKAPEGYVLDNDKTGVMVTEEETSEVTIRNAPIPPGQPDPVTTGFIRMIKKDGDKGDSLSGAVFGVYTAANDVKVDEIITGADGTVTSAELTAGEYYIRELKAPDGYVLNNEKIGASVKSGETIELIIFNAPIPQVQPAPDAVGFIKLVKRSENTGKLLPGAVFGLYTEKSNVKIGELVTGEDGTVTSGELSVGNYYIRELAAPEGYALGSERIGINVRAGETNEITVFNTPLDANPAPQLTGYIRLIKRAEDTGDRLYGAVFGIYEAANGYKVGELFTDRNGIAVSAALPAGAYYIRELAAPSGYKLNGEKLLAYAVAGETREITVTNIPEAQSTPTNGYIRIRKYAEDTKEPLSDAIFGIYNANTGSKVGEITTGRGGTATSAALPAGEYYITELKAPDGYLLNRERFNVRVIAGETYELSVANKPEENEHYTPTSLKIIKVAAGTGEPLLGAVFGIYEAASEKKVQEVTTGSNGTAYSTRLPDGAYFLMEHRAPSGYKTNTEKIYFYLKAGESKEITVTNKPEETVKPVYSNSYVQIIKRMEGLGTPLAGAVFGIYKASTDEKVAELTTGAGGTAKSAALPAVEYYVLELKAPTGFKLKNDKTSFKLNAGETKEITILNAPKTDEPITGVLNLTKKAETTGVKLSGAVFGVFDAVTNARITEITTDADGSALYNLPAGSYYLWELKAPSGFALEPAQIPFNIKSGETVRVEVTDVAEKGSVRLKNKGVDNEAIEGSVFGLFNAATGVKITEIATSSGGTVLYELPGGTYYFQQISVPTGYLLNNEKHSFFVTSGQIIDVTVYNKRVTTTQGGIYVPKTGEPYPYGSYVLAALFAGITILSGVSLYKRSKKKRTK